MIRIILKGRPMSTQHIYWFRWKVKYMKSAGKEMKKDYINQILNQYTGPIIEYLLEIRISVYRKWAQLDRDNMHKISMDAMNWIVRNDDSQIRKAIVHLVKKDNSNPRIEIEIEKYEQKNSPFGESVHTANEQKISTDLFWNIK